MRTLLTMDGDQGFPGRVEGVAASLGFTVYTAKTGQEFMALYRRHAPEVILLGIVMPEVDGFELTTWLCEQGATARLLLVSAHNPLYAIWLSRLAEINAALSVEILQRPVSETELAAALEGPALPAGPGRIREGSNADNDPAAPGDD